MKVLGNLRFDFRGQSQQIQHTRADNGNGGGLCADNIDRAPHNQREHRSAEQSHNHQARHFVFLGFVMQQSAGENNRKHVGVSESYHRHRRRQDGFFRPEPKHESSRRHHQNAQQKEQAVADFCQSETARQTADCSEQKVHACRIARGFQRRAELFH